MPAEAKAKALADLAAAHVHFKETVRGIPDDKLTVPMHGEWSVKDLIAHVSSWSEMGALDMARVGRGHVPCVAAFREADVDDWNACLMRSRNLFSLAQAMFELEDARRQLVDALNALPDNLFTAGQMARMLIDGLVHGEQGHAVDIQDWRQKQGA